MQSRILFSLLAFVACFLIIHAAPVPEEITSLEKRIDHTGRGTWFNVGLGNCGKTNKDSDLIVAIPKSIYDANGGNNCEQYVEIQDLKTGKKAYGKTRDSCPSCGWGDIDVSPSLFKKFQPLSVGVLKVKWHFMKKGWKP